MITNYQNQQEYNAQIRENIELAKKDWQEFIKTIYEESIKNKHLISPASIGLQAHLVLNRFQFLKLLVSPSWSMYSSNSD